MSHEVRSDLLEDLFGSEHDALGDDAFGGRIDQHVERWPANIEVVYVGLNPARAREIAATVPALQRPGLDLLFIEV